MENNNITTNQYLNNKYIDGEQLDDDGTILFCDALEAIRLSKIEVLKEAVELLKEERKGFSVGSNSRSTYTLVIESLNNKINTLANGK